MLANICKLLHLRFMAYRVVIVDDHPVLRQGLRGVFSREEDLIVVGEAEDGDSARALIEKEAPDLVLLDVNMPGEGGLPVVKWVRETRDQTKVLLMTGDVDGPLVQACLLAGADGVVTKNTHAQEMVRAVRTVAQGGSYLSSEATKAVVAAVRSQLGADRKPASLTPQELAVLKGIAQGLGFKEIAMRMQLSPKTVETYRARLVRKTGLRTKVALARFAVERGLDKM
ncbi:MAG: response regulator transcription factor [Opitutaceae bacterium]|nr:response regulator transcription factor [Opitutaceae bacterium]